jgi:hypothetical protein
MTKFRDKPYSIKLLPGYAKGSKKFPTVKSMNREGKAATCKGHHHRLYGKHPGCARGASILEASLG